MCCVVLCAKFMPLFLLNKSMTVFHHLYTLYILDKILEVQKIQQLSELHNFRYEESGIRVWKAYAVGVDRLIPWQSLYIRHQGCTNISLMEGKGFFTNTEIRDFHRPRKRQASRDDVEIDDQPSMWCALKKAVIALLTLSPNLRFIQT